AAAAGAKPPRHVPLWLCRLVAGEAAAVMMTSVRGASNARAKRELGWSPAHPSWRTGFAELASEPGAAPGRRPFLAAIGANKGHPGA
ncbi:MAG TPA: hypothetical protein VJT75_17780, partial [Thermoleophilaceae bacterium]|nr:hypothetical protein [Thermoleophilaceae bacterium]